MKAKPTSPVPPRSLFPQERALLIRICERGGLKRRWFGWPCDFEDLQALERMGDVKLLPMPGERRPRHALPTRQGYGRAGVEVWEPLTHIRELFLGL